MPFLRYLTAALAAVVVACSREPPDGVVLAGATLIDGSGAPPRRDAVVVVRAGRISAVGGRGEMEIPDQLPVIELAGRWIIPGLIDAHAHVAPWALTRYLAWGVTSVRDVHGTLDSILPLREQVNLHALAGPRIYSAGSMIDGLPATYPDAIGANGPPDGRKGVDRLVREGVDLVKVYTRADPPLLRAVVDEASTFKLPIAAHLGLTDALTAARVGVRSIEHLSGVPEAAVGDPSALYAAHYRGFFPGWTAFERSWATLDSAVLERVARDLAKHKVFLVPTLVLHETFSRLDDSATVRDTMLKVVPESQQQAWDVTDMVRRAGWAAADFASFRRSRSRQDMFVRAFASAGGRIAAGTDASNQLIIPGYSQHRELQLLVAAGLTPEAALRAATASGAALLGTDSIGVVAPGRVADLVVLTRDPLRDIANTLAVEQVMTRGRLLRPDSIRGEW